MSDRGVAHVLEHLVFCGSARFPTEDLLFQASNETRFTHMSAFTKIDWTGFSFSSNDRSDFEQLLDRYVDAVFFPRLDELSYLREGCRYELTDAGDPDSAVRCSGVVYNEMAGAMDSPIARLWYSLARQLYAGTPYRFNNCGRPEEIPRCTHSEVVDYHRRYYRPGRAVVFTTGPIDPGRTHRLLARALAEGERVHAAPEVGWQAIGERRLLDLQPALADRPGGGAHLLLGWRLQPASDLGRELAYRLMANALLGTPGALLRRVLETTPIGEAVSPLCGLESGYPEPAFVCGLEGCGSSDAEPLVRTVREALTFASSRGLPERHVRSAMERLELWCERGEVGDGPAWRNELMAPMRAALRGGDVLSFFDREARLRALRRVVGEPRWLPELIRQALLENDRHVCHLHQPDADADATRLGEDAPRRLPATVRRRLVEQTAAMRERIRRSETNPSPTGWTAPDAALSGAEPVKLEPPHRGCPTTCRLPALRVVHHRVAVDLAPLDAAMLPLVPTYSRWLTGVAPVGADEGGALGSLGSSLQVRAEVDDTRELMITLDLWAESVSRARAVYAEHLRGLLRAPPRLEAPRLRGIAHAWVRMKRHDIAQNAHAYLLCAASGVFSAGSWLRERTVGLSAYVSMKAALEAARSGEPAILLDGAVDDLRRGLARAPRAHLVVSSLERRTVARSFADVRPEEASLRAAQCSPGSPSGDPPACVAWLSTVPRASCAVAFRTVAAAHEDAPALTLLGHFLQVGFLYRALRLHGDSYACGAGSDASNGTFRFFSARDADPLRSLDAFTRSVQWVIAGGGNAATLEAAKIRAFSALDSTEGGVDAAVRAFSNHVFRRPRPHRRRYRARLATATLADVRRVAGSYLTHPSNTVVLAPRGERSRLERAGFSLREL